MITIIGNWDNEIRKWVGDKCNVFPVKSDAVKIIKQYLQVSAFIDNQYDL